MKNEILIIQDVNDLVQILAQQIRIIVKEELVNLNRESKQDEKKKYLTRKEICSRINISYPTLHRLVNNEIITCYKVGRRSLFNAKEIEDIILQKNV